MIENNWAENCCRKFRFKKYSFLIFPWIADRVRHEVPYDFGFLGSKGAELNSDHDSMFQNSWKPHTFAWAWILWSKNGLFSVFGQNHFTLRSSTREISRNKKLLIYFIRKTYRQTVDGGGKYSKMVSKVGHLTIFSIFFLEISELTQILRLERCKIKFWIEWYRLEILKITWFCVGVD